MTRRAAFLLLAVVAIGVGGVLLPRREPRPVSRTPVTDVAHEKDPYHRWGRKFFDDAVRWVWRGGDGVERVESLYLELDAQVLLDNSRQEGQLRVWLRGRRRFRVDTTANGATTTRTWDRHAGWIRDPDGRIVDLVPDGESDEDVRLLHAHRAAYADLGRIVALRPLACAGARFRYEGLKEGSGTYAGSWIKVAREMPGQPDVTLWLAYEGAPQRGYAATWPGIVRIEGDLEPDVAPRDYVLRDWIPAKALGAHACRYPRRIEAYALREGPDGRRSPERFLWAIAEEIRFDEPIDPEVFLRTPD